MSLSLPGKSWTDACEPGHDGLVGVLDIGSNSVRLVVFEGDGRMPIPLFNEKALCGLGKGLQETGYLPERGVQSALENLERYFTIARGMGVSGISVLATAAVRDARNGDAFVASVEARYGQKVTVLSGDEEARLSALGVISAFPEADGIVGDLGGGSLELVNIRKGQAQSPVSMPLGPLRLGELTRQNRGDMTRKIDASLAGIDWLSRTGARSSGTRPGEGRALFAVGGAWRSLARAHMELTDYPLEVIHHYAIGAGEAIGFLDEITRMGRRDLRLLDGVSRRRIDKLPVTALVLKRVLETGQLREVIFSAFGLREGCLYDRLPRSARVRDPLVASCVHIARKSSRFSPRSEALAHWIAPFFEDIDAEAWRLVRAACTLSDIAWSEHPRYRGEHAFNRVLRLPVVGLDHADRVFLASVILVRYTGGLDEAGFQRVRKLLTLGRRHLAFRVGLALRLALTLTGGAAVLLESARPELQPEPHVPGHDIAGERGGFVIRMQEYPGNLAGDVVTRRLAALADALGRDIRIAG